jgi:hypothetical protein
MGSMGQEQPCVPPGGALRDREHRGLGVIPDGVALSVTLRAVQGQSSGERPRGNAHR